MLMRLGGFNFQEAHELTVDEAEEWIAHAMHFEKTYMK